MADIMEFADVPYLDELINFLPIDAIDKEDVNTYLKNVTDSILLNYSGEQYQFAYFGMHLLYMTYIYFSVKKISLIIPERYRDAIVFAKPYHGQKLDFYNMESAFGYSLVAEKEFPNILKIIDLDNGQIGKISGLVDNRNEMAHANGRFVILTEEAFKAATNGILDSIKNIHNRMEKHIKIWFNQFLIRYCNNEFEEYNDNIKEIITEQMVQEFNLSVKELHVCKEMSVRDIIIDNRRFEHILKDFKAILSSYCEDLVYE